MPTESPRRLMRRSRRIWKPLKPLKTLKPLKPLKTLRWLKKSRRPRLRMLKLMMGLRTRRPAPSGATRLVRPGGRRIFPLRPCCFRPRTPRALDAVVVR